MSTTPKPIVRDGDPSDRILGRLSEITSGNQPATVTGAVEQGNKAKLEFLELPIDVLLEIFSHLEPVDLLHVSRVSRHLHRFLRSDNSLYIWSSAYTNISKDSQPPKCPDGVNIMHYTNFLYGVHCQFCSDDDASFYHMSTFVRLCLRCKESRLMGWKDDQAPEELCYPWTFQKPQYKVLILKAEYDLRRRELHEALSEGRAEKYTNIRKDEIKSRATHARNLDNWRTEYEKERQVRIARRESDIKDKLIDEGYRIQVSAFVFNFWQLPHVTEKKELTELGKVKDFLQKYAKFNLSQEWNYIRVEVIDRLQDLYEGRQFFWIRRQLLARLERLHKIIHEQLGISRPQITPTEFYIASMEPFISFIKADINKLAIDIVRRFEPRLREFIASWKEEMDEYLVKLVPGAWGAESGSGRKRFLELGTTFFKCPKCTDPVPYSQILMHECLVQVSGPNLQPADEVKQPEYILQEGEDEDERRETHSHQINREPRPSKTITVDMVWSSLLKDFRANVAFGKVGITFHSHAHVAARNVILACREDPSTITYARMEEKDVRLGCLRCTQKVLFGKPGRTIMRWTSAILHEIDFHHEGISTGRTWEVIKSNGDLEKVRQEESRIMKESEGTLFCLYCREGQQKVQLLQHLEHAHRMKVTDLLSHHFYEDVRRTRPNAVVIR